MTPARRPRSRSISSGQKACKFCRRSSLLLGTVATASDGALQGDLTDDPSRPPTGTKAPAVGGWLTLSDEVTTMPLTERSRHKLYETFTALIDDETAVQEMLSYFPARDVEEPVTKDFLRAELQTEIGALRAELHAEIGGLRAELQSEVGAVRLEVGELRAEMHQTARATQTWIISTGLSLAGLILAVARFG